MTSPAPAARASWSRLSIPMGRPPSRAFQTGDIILDVGGKAVANASDVRNALTEAKAQGKHDVLMRVKTATPPGSSPCRSATPDTSAFPRPRIPAIAGIACCRRDGNRQLLHPLHG